MKVKFVKFLIKAVICEITYIYKYQTETSFITKSTNRMIKMKHCREYVSKFQVFAVSRKFSELPIR